MNYQASAMTLESRSRGVSSALRSMGVSNRQHFSKRILDFWPAFGSLQLSTYCGRTSGIRSTNRRFAGRRFKLPARPGRQI